MALTNILVPGFLRASPGERTTGGLHRRGEPFKRVSAVRPVCDVSDGWVVDLCPCAYFMNPSVAIKISFVWELGVRALLHERFLYIICSTALCVRNIMTAGHRVDWRGDLVFGECIVAARSTDSDILIHGAAACHADALVSCIRVCGAAP